jgi:acyl-CoA synthetase (AMP-forming)/AMP-acid ligase II/acyl carrier protein
MKGGDRGATPAVSPAALVALQAARDAAAPAILAPGRPALTFGALADLVAATAQRLAAMGLGRGSRVALVLPDGPEMAAALYAVTEAATCAPLDPAIDEAACLALLQRMRIDALIVAQDADLAAERAAAALGLQLIILSTDPGATAGAFELFSTHPRPAMARMPPRGDDIALVLHTSGTTSAPKIVPNTYASLVSGALSRVGLLQLTANDRGLCVSPLTTSAGIRRSLYPVLTAGGSIVCPVAFDVTTFFDLLDEFKPTFYAAGPTVHRAVLDEAVRRGVTGHSLRFILCGTGALAPDLQCGLERAFGVPAIQAYGMTETSTIAQNPLPPGQRRAGSVGLPAGCQVAILGDDGTLLAPQQAGEIVVRGPTVFHGYENNDEANRESLHHGWFRTGDVGHVDADGYLFVAGRMKEIINRGGSKVLPLEVDAVLMTLAGVVDAACFGVPHPTLGEDVAAAVVLRPDATVSSQQLRDAALERMPAYKVPSRIVLVSTIPRDMQGKVRRRELPAAMAQAMRTAYSPPQGRLQELVADCFSLVLGIERIGAHDNFFELGGDSLRGTQVVVRLNAALGLEVGAVELFRRPTVAELAAALEVASAGAARGSPPALIPRPRRRQPGTTIDS